MVIYIYLYIYGDYMFVPRLDLSWGYRCYRDYTSWFSSQVTLTSLNGCVICVYNIYLFLRFLEQFLILPMPHVHHFGTQRSMIRSVIRKRKLYIKPCVSFNM